MLTGSSDPRAEELQRRIILSRYLMRVNEAGDLPPQEVRGQFEFASVLASDHLQSGLVNDGWVRVGAYGTLPLLKPTSAVRKIPHGTDLVAPRTLGSVE